MPRLRGGRAEGDPPGRRDANACIVPESMPRCWHGMGPEWHDMAQVLTRPPRHPRAAARSLSSAVLSTKACCIRTNYLLSFWSRMEKLGGAERPSRLQLDERSRRPPGGSQAACGSPCMCHQ